MELQWCGVFGVVMASGHVPRARAATPGVAGRSPADASLYPLHFVGFASSPYTPPCLCVAAAAFRCVLRHGFAVPALLRLATAPAWQSQPYPCTGVRSARMEDASRHNNNRSGAASLAYKIIHKKAHRRTVGSCVFTTDYSSRGAGTSMQIRSSSAATPRPVLPLTRLTLSAG